jgi:hypothetical protein
MNRHCPEGITNKWGPRDGWVINSEIVLGTLENTID